MSNSGYRPVGPVRMYYEIHGKQQGVPLVLLHGGGSSIGATFGRIIPQLAKTHWVIGVEQQGHGHTADIDRPYTLEQMADDTAALLAQLDITSANFLGFSNGGQVALQLAVRHPQIIHKLIVASGFYSREGVIPELQAGWQKSITPDDMPADLRDDFLQTAPEPKDLQRHIDKSQQMMQTFKDLPPGDLKKFDFPSLIIVGDHDVVRLEHAVDMSRLIPSARLVVLPGAHGAYIGELSTPQVKTNMPHVTVAIVNDFLDGSLPI